MLTTAVLETIGTRCEDPANLAQVGGLRRPPRHIGCPGFWHETFDARGGTRCACSCHDVTTEQPSVFDDDPIVIPAVSPAKFSRWKKTE